MAAFARGACSQRHFLNYQKKVHNLTPARIQKYFAKMRTAPRLSSIFCSRDEPFLHRQTSSGIYKAGGKK
jgi:hypothetical protein